MKTPTIKLTTLATWLLMATIGGYIGSEYQAMKTAAEIQTLESAGFINKAKSEPIAHYIDGGVY